MCDDLTGELPLIARASQHDQRVAIGGPAGPFSYRDILDRSAAAAAELLDGSADLDQARIAFLVPAGFEHVYTQWAIWRAGGMAVPLSLFATEPEIRYTLEDSRASAVVVARNLKPRVDTLCHTLGLRLMVTEAINLAASDRATDLPTVTTDRPAMILYTSGTTGQPKGVVSTHATIQAQIETLAGAWHWRADDSIPLFLPLHHIHAIINVMSCALWAGATIEPFPRFDMEAVLQRVAGGAYTVFMAVPVIYIKIIQHLATRKDPERQKIIDGFSGMRLMVSGSAALPASIHKAWAALTGQQLLERYGMTEIGMALSNPYEGERRPGTVGQPLPGVEIRLMAETGQPVTGEGEPGQIQVRGPGVFSEYWRRPEATDAAFEDGWFSTGDLAVLRDGYFQIMGRHSVDIIKSGGYKLSALEIEAILLDHPAIAECAVVGIPDDTWGETVAVAIVLRGDSRLDVAELRRWSLERLSPYKIPRRWLAVTGLPRNAMGKVTKPAVRELFE